MWLQLAQKTAIVTGAGSGIGAAVARSLVAQGCHVVLADRSADAMERVVLELTDQQQQQQQLANQNDDDENNKSHLLAIECNVSQQSQVQALMKEADATMPSRPTLLVNCAGITRDGWVGKMSFESWQSVLDVNLTGTFLCCRAFLDQDRIKNLLQQRPLEESNKSTINSQIATRENLSIVNIASVVGRYGNLGQANYAASKAGVIGLTKALAKETAVRGCRVNAILPGFINTPMAHAVPDHVKEQMIPKIAMKRFGEPEEVADLASFLLSPRSSYMTGEALEVSGMIAL